MTRGALDAGADASLQVVPYYNKPTQEGMYLHFRTIAEAVDIPIILYNVPGRTACDMLSETVRRLADLPNVVGIKDATGDMDRAGELIRVCPDDFAVYSGDDSTALDLILLGGKGSISVTANVAATAVHDMCVAAMAGNTERAGEIERRLSALNKALFLESNPIPVKWAVAEMGLARHNAIRLPLTPLSARFHKAVKDAMIAAEIVLPTTTESTSQ